MRFIAHRGNLNGPSELENSPSQIDFCLNQSIDCEVDLWVKNGVFFLGHDSGQNMIDQEWLISRQDFLWIHCKNADAINNLLDIKNSSLNFFWHQNDDYTITSKKNVWVYPGQRVIPGSVCVLPENWITLDRQDEVFQSYAICTDYVHKFQREFAS